MASPNVPHLKTLRCAALFAGALAGFPGHGSTQSAPPAPPSELTISAGVLQSGRFDATASPFQFGGRTVGFALDYERAIGGFALVGRVDGSAGSLAPLAADGLSHERLTEAAGHLTLLRALPVAATGRFSFGADLGGAISVTDHTYADATTSAYVFGLVTLGPAAEWRQPFRGGTFTVLAAVPVVAAVDHPYTAFTDRRAGIDFRFATLDRIRGLNGTLAYATDERRRVGLIYAYRFEFLRYDDVQAVRAASQTFSVGFVARFGAR